jgi:hypothetical protein
MPRPAGTKNKIAQSLPQVLGKRTTPTDAIRIGKLNGGYVMLTQPHWNFIQECLEKAGYKLTFTTELLLHGANEGDIAAPKTMTAGAGFGT